LAISGTKVPSAPPGPGPVSQGTGEGRPKGGHALAILPGLTHYNIVSSPLLAAVTLPFLDSEPG
jgi:hypothetical protein